MGSGRQSGEKPRREDTFVGTTYCRRRRNVQAALLVRYVVGVGRKLKETRTVRGRGLLCSRVAKRN